MGWGVGRVALGVGAGVGVCCVGLSLGCQLRGGQRAELLQLPSQGAPQHSYTFSSITVGLTCQNCVGGGGGCPA